jgi:hypothetical protein
VSDSEERRQEAVMLALAERLRETALAAGRTDVAAKAGEAAGLLRVADRPDGKDTNNVVIRILDGLGF